MIFDIETEVYIEGIGTAKHYHTQEFADDSNEFGRVIEYREYIHRIFPNCDYKLIQAVERRKNNENQ